MFRVAESSTQLSGRPLDGVRYPVWSGQGDWPDASGHSRSDRSGREGCPYKVKEGAELGKRWLTGASNTEESCVKHGRRRWPVARLVQPNSCMFCVAKVSEFAAVLHSDRGTSAACLLTTEKRRSDAVWYVDFRYFSADAEWFREHLFTFGCSCGRTSGRCS